MKNNKNCYSSLGNFVKVEIKSSKNIHIKHHISKSYEQKYRILLKTILKFFFLANGFYLQVRS